MAKRGESHLRLLAECYCRFEDYNFEISLRLLRKMKEIAQDQGLCQREVPVKCGILAKTIDNNLVETIRDLALGQGDTQAKKGLRL